MISIEVNTYPIPRTADNHFLVEPVVRVIYFAQGPEEITLGHYQRFLDAVNNLPEFIKYVVGWKEINPKNKVPNNYTWKNCSDEEKKEIVISLVKVCEIAAFQLSEKNTVIEGKEMRKYFYSPNEEPLDFSGVWRFIENRGYNAAASIQGLFDAWFRIFALLVVKPQSESDYVSQKKNLTGKFEIPENPNDPTAKKRYFYINKATIGDDMVKATLDPNSSYNASYGGFTWYEASHALHGWETIKEKQEGQYKAMVLNALASLAVEYELEGDKINVIPRLAIGEKATQQRRELTNFFNDKMPLSIAFEVGFFLNFSLQQQLIPLGITLTRPNSQSKKNQQSSH